MSDPITELREAFAAQAKQLPAAGAARRYRPRTRAGLRTTAGLGITGLALAAVAVAVAVTNTAGPDPTTVAGATTSATTPGTVSAQPAGETIAVDLVGYHITLTARLRDGGEECPLPEATWPGLIVSRYLVYPLEDGTCLGLHASSEVLAAPPGAQPVAVDGETGWAAEEGGALIVAAPLPAIGGTIIVEITNPAGTPTLQDALAIIAGLNVTQSVQPS